MDVSVVIVSWKVRTLAERCLRSLFSHTRGVSFEAFLVDNASGDGTVEMARAGFPEARVIANDDNKGFAAACNQAIRESTGEFVLLLNPDCMLHDDVVSAMVRWMREHPEAAIMGPTLLNEDGTVQESVSAFPSLTDQALVMLKAHNVMMDSNALKRYFMHGFDYGRAARVDQVKGAAFMIRRSVVNRLGLLDEGFFIWYEEVDWCKRAADSDMATWYAPCAKIVHGGGASFGQVFGPKRQRMLNRSMRRYARKHLGLGAYLVLLALHPLSMVLAYLAAPLTNRRYVRTRH